MIKMKIIVLGTLIFASIISSAAISGVPLTFHGSLTEQLYRPIDIAVNQEGDIAVADIYRKQIYRYTGEKKFISSISLSEYPTCVGFDAVGNIYIGTRNDVQIVNKSGEIIDKLSQHGLTFQSIVDLAVDTKGKIYIVDRDAHRINVVNSAREIEFYFGGLGKETGQLCHPSGIALNEKTGEMIVADAGNSRIQIFSGEGKYINSFGEHIKQIEGGWQFVGTFAQMSGVSIDSENRIYVSDGGLDHVQIFDINGNHLGFLGRTGERAGRLRVPAGIFISSNGKLFVTSTTGSEVKEYSIELTTDVTDDQLSKPNKYLLEQNYPNPFNPSTKISFSLPEQGYVTLKIYDVLGKEINTLADQDYKSGAYEITWNGKDNSGNEVSSGIYFYQLQVGEKFSQTNKMIFLR